MKRKLIVGLFCAVVGIAVAVFVTQSLASRSPAEGNLTQGMKTTLQTLPHLRGAPITEATFDDNVVVVTFFASWCPPCREEFTHLSEIHADYQDAGVAIIAINLFEAFDNFSNDERLAAFLSKTQPPFTVVKGNDAISQQFGTITRIPSLFIFDRQGRRAVRFAHERGAQQMTLSAAALRQAIAGLL